MKTIVVAYQIFIRSFADGNGDGIGDFEGIRQKIPYLQNLGIKLIWLTPVQKAESYHGYDITDYYSVHPDYGSMDDFKRLVSELHQAGIKVLIDLVIHHTSTKHPWFRTAIQNPESKEFNYYQWSQHKKNKKYHATPNGLFYNGHFWSEMPDLNIENPSLKKEIYQLANFWLTETQIDGFRIDAVYYFFEPGKIDKNVAWWKQFRQALKPTTETPVLLGEIWADASYIAPFLEKAFDMAFNFWLANEIIQCIQRKNHNNLVENLMAVHARYAKYNKNFTDAIFLSNHDLERVASRLDGDSEKIKLAASILFTLPGMPFIYYGEELGMPGKKPDEYLREPFLWDSTGEESAQTRWLSPRYAKPQKVPSLNEQKHDPNSIFNHYRRIISLRNQNTTLQEAPLIQAAVEDDGVLQFIRSHTSNKILVVHNLRNQPLNLSPWKDKYPFGEPIFCSASCNDLSGLPPYQSLIVNLN